MIRKDLSKSSSKKVHTGLTHFTIRHYEYKEQGRIYGKGPIV